MTERRTALRAPRPAATAATGDSVRVLAPVDDPDPSSPFGGPVRLSPTASSLGLYIHVPFCTARCPFCSFTTAPFREESMGRYLRALDREIDLVRGLEWAAGVQLEAIFLGGGTPSLLPAEELARILDHVGACFTVPADAEITSECNPESASRSKLEAFRTAGVTRVSLGVQTLDDGVLRRLGRLHTAADARAAFVAAREAAVPQVSVDLMYGLPGLGVDDWRRTVDTVLGWRPDHVSAYGLTLDHGSRWGSEGVCGLPDEEVVVAQYWELARAAARAGYEHYEISNYALPGCRSRHNQIYWQHREYVALGPGACGFVGDVRYGNARSVERYCDLLERGRLPVTEHERLTDRQQAGERLMLGLRTRDGVPAEWLRARVARNRSLGARLATWEHAGLLSLSGGSARLTEAGFLLSDALFVELL